VVVQQVQSVGGLKCGGVTNGKNSVTLTYFLAPPCILVAYVTDIFPQANIFITAAAAAELKPRAGSFRC